MSITLTKQELQDLITSAVSAAVAGSTAAKQNEPAKKTSKAKKSQDGAPKKPSGGQQIWREQVDNVYAEMKAAWYAKHPEHQGKDEKEIRKMCKDDPLPKYGDALQEASRRRCEVDPEHKKKADAYRVKTDKMIAERRAKKAAEKQSKKTKTPEKVSEPEDVDPDVYDEEIEIDGVTYVKNKKNMVATIPENDDDEAELVGIWNPKTKTLDDLPDDLE